MSSLSRRVRQSPSKISPSTGGLRSSIDRLERTLREIPENYRIVFSPAHNLSFTFLRGVVYGLGMLFAIAIVIPIILALLREVQWVPLLGNFFERVLEQMETSVQQYPR